MKYSVTALALFTGVVITGCSDRDSAQSNATVSGPAAPVVSRIDQDLPFEIKGFPFELGGKCAIDSVNSVSQGETVTVSRSDGLYVDGWAFEEKDVAVPSAIVLQLASGEGRYHALLNRHGGREDLTKAFGKPEFSDAGYSGHVDIASLPTGLYEILIIQKWEDKNLVCPTYRKLAVNN